MGKIGDLFVKLGLKSDEFNKGIEDAKGGVQELEGKTSSLKKVGVAAWAALTAAVVKFATDSIKLTQKFGDAWAITMEGVKGAYSSFVRQIASGEGWDNLFKNMAEAFRQSKEFAAAMDEMFERNNSYNLEAAQTEKYISELQLIMRDSSKSDAERKKAAEQIIEAEQKLANIRRGIAQDDLEAKRKQLQSQTGMSQEAIDYIVNNYEKNRESINQALDYQAQMKELNKELVLDMQNLSRAPGMAKEWNAEIDSIKAKIKELDSTTSASTKKIAEYLDQYNLSDDSLVKAYVDAEIALINVDTEANRASTRATAMLGSLNNKIEVTTEAAQALVPVLRDLADVELGGVSPIKGEAEYTDTSGLDGIDKMQERWSEYAQRMTDYFQMIQEASAALTQSLQRGLIGAFEELADVIAGVEGANFGTVVKALLTPLADMAIQAGTIIMTTGEAMEALEAALTSALGPAGAIVAGAALVGIGIAAKAGLSAIGRGGSTSMATSYGGASNSNVNGRGAENVEITVHLEGRLSGQDILLASRKAELALGR